MNELKPCPFCGKEPATRANFAICINDDCEQSIYWSGLDFDSWNTRPTEDALNARIAELERRAARAKELLQDEMGDWLTVEAIYMPDHYLQLKQTIDVLDGGGE